MRNQNSEMMFQCHQKACGFSCTSCFFHNYRMQSSCLYTKHRLYYTALLGIFLLSSNFVLANYESHDATCMMPHNRHWYAYTLPGQWRDQKSAILEDFVVTESPLRRFPIWRLWSMEEDCLGPTDYVQYDIVLTWLSNIPTSVLDAQNSISPRMDLHTTYCITVFIFTHYLHLHSQEQYLLL